MKDGGGGMGENRWQRYKKVRGSKGGIVIILIKKWWNMKQMKHKENTERLCAETWSRRNVSKGCIYREVEEKSGEQRTDQKSSFETKEDKKESK